MREAGHHPGSVLPRMLGVTAITIGRRVFWAREVVPGLVAHELEHVRQFAQHGVARFIARYVLDYLGGRARGLSHHEAYLAIPFEVEARDAESRDA